MSQFFFFVKELFIIVQLIITVLGRVHDTDTGVGFDLNHQNDTIRGTLPPVEEYSDTAYTE